MTVVMIGHASLGPSKAYQWGSCPGSIPLIGTIPENMREGSSEFAQLGTATHDLIERCLNQNLQPYKFKDRVIEIILDLDGNEGTSMLRKGAKMPGAGRTAFQVDDEMIENATMFTDYVVQQITDRGLTPDDLKAERKTKALPEREDCWGTVDVTIDDWMDLLEVVDYKNGAGVLVEVKGNRQTRLYLLGVALETNFSHGRYRHTIVQPNMAHPDGHIRSEDVTAEELKEFHLYMLKKASNVDIAQEAFDAIEGNCHEPNTSEEFRKWDEAYLHADPDICKFCEALAICPAAQRKNFEMAGIDFDDDPEFEIDIPIPEEIEHVRKCLAWASLFDDWTKALKAYGQRYLENGGDPESIGQKMVRGTSRREWRVMTDKQRLAALKKLIGADFSKESFFVPEKFITGPKAEKFIPKEMKKEFNETLLFKPEPGLTMAPLADKREAVTVGAGDDFDDEDL